MSEIHNELVKVAGDLTASKERVKKQVLKQAHINRRKASSIHPVNSSTDTLCGGICYGAASYE